MRRHARRHPSDRAALAALESGQRGSERLQPLPRRTLAAPALLLLWALRVYVLIAVPVVIYEFTHALLSSSHQ